MNSIKLISQRVGYVVAAGAVALSIVLPVVVSAAQVTERSVALSNSSAGSDNVSYQINFTSVGAAGAFLVDFCSNSPLVGQDCTAPAGFSATSAASTTPGFTAVTGSTNRIVVTGTIGSDANISVDVTGINNPDAAGTLYARIVTFDTNTAANASTPTNLNGSIDQGGVAISITPTIGVSGTVLETLTFCVSGDDGAAANPIQANCTGTLTAPTLELGEQTGDIIALAPGVISEGTIYTQISTNAESGAVVRLKSDATECGGLLRAGAPAGTCDILPAMNLGITEATADARFGVKTATATGSTGAGITPSGTLSPAAGSIYSNTNYALNYVEGDATGVTGTFGDPFLDTNSQPANNQNMALTFGVKVTNDTPAGAYSADLSMIAVGKF